jgi:hypothetical protein
MRTKRHEKHHSQNWRFSFLLPCFLLGTYDEKYSGCRRARKYYVSFVVSIWTRCKEPWRSNYNSWQGDDTKLHLLPIGLRLFFCAKEVNLQAKTIASAVPRANRAAIFKMCVTRQLLFTMPPGGCPARFTPAGPARWAGHLRAAALRRLQPSSKRRVNSPTSN